MYSINFSSDTTVILAELECFESDKTSLKHEIW